MPNPGSYTLNEVPPAPAGFGSRFYLPRSTGGWPAEADDQLGDAYASLAMARKASQPKAPPPTVSVALKLAVKDAGAWTLRDRGKIELEQTIANTRPGKLGACKLEGGALLDSFMLGEEAWETATDQAVWEALRVTLEVHGASGRGWRTANDAVAVAICARAGVEVKAGALPDPFSSPRKRRFDGRR